MFYNNYFKIQQTVKFLDRYLREIRERYKKK